MSFNQYQLEQYTLSLVRNKNRKCTTCKQNKAQHLTYDSDMGSVGYLCRDCYNAYCIQLEDNERKERWRIRNKDGY